MRAALTRWGLMVLVVGVTTWINFGIQRLTGGRMPFLPYFPATIIMTLLAGAGPALAGVALSAVLLSLIWLEPGGSLLLLQHAEDRFGLLFFVLAALLMIAVAEASRRSLASLRSAKIDLARTRRRLDAAHEAAQMVEWDWDLATDRMEMSASAGSVLGAAWERLEDVWPHLHPDDRARVEGTVRDAVARGADYEFMGRIIRPDTGETRWLETRAVVHKRHDGKPSHVTGVTMDVTGRQAALEAARATEQRLRVALGSGAIVAWACDAERRYTWVYNPGTGFHPSEFTGRTVGSMLPPESRRLYAEALDRVWATGEGERVAMDWVHDGTLRHFVSSIDLLRDGTGTAVGMVGASMDLTELRRAEQLARRNAERFERAFFGSPDGLIISGLEDGIIHEVNPSFLAIVDREREAVVGRRSAEVGIAIAAEDRARALERLRAEGRLRNVELDVHRPGGERRIVTCSSELVEMDDRPAILTLVRDVTEQKRTDAALRESEERLRLALEGGRFGMWECDLVTGMTHCTPLNNELFGLDPATASMPTDDWYRLIHPDDLPGVVAVWQAAAAGDGKPFTVEFRIIRPDGAMRWMHARARFHRDAHDVMSRAVGITMDVTERKAAEEALREADRRKDEFLATLAHELRNPLAPLNTAAYLLRAGAGDVIDRAAQEMIVRQVSHMTRLVDDLLDVSRLNVGRLELRPETVSLADVVEQALETAGPAIAAARHRLTVTLGPEPLVVRADVVRLAQVFTNLLTNAARYTPEGGHIGVSVEAAGTDAIVTVEDSGIGIAPELLTQVFEMFTQVSQADGTWRGGLGIGLSLARRLVEMHGGTIEAHSAGRGRGSRFRVCLPLSGSPLPIPVNELAPAAMPGENGHRRVLIVDDNTDAAESLAMLLRLRGHDVGTAFSGEEALDTLARERFEVVLLDLGLPSLDGYQVARRVRERFGPAAPKLVALTGWGQDADRARTSEAGFDGHLLKPADPSAVTRLIEQLEPHR